MEEDKRSLSLAVVDPVVPDFISEVATEKASYFLHPRLFTVEETAGGEVVGLAALLELLVGSEGFVRVVLKVAKALEELLCGDVPQVRLAVQCIPPFSRVSSLNNTYIL